LLLDVDARHLQPVPFLACELSEEAFHPAGGPRLPGGEENEEVPTTPAGPPGAAGHTIVFPAARGGETPSH